MKHQLRILGLALLFTACDGATETIPEPRAAAPGLHWSKGEKWQQQTEFVSVRKGTYLLQGDTLKPCQWDWDFDGSCTSPIERTRTSTTLSYSEVTATTKIISFDAPGYVIAETSETEITWFPEPEYSSEPEIERGARLYILVPHNAFVVKLEDAAREWWQLTPDADLTRGEALYPAAPAAGSVYTDDAGQSWRGVAAETLTIDEKPINAMIVEKAVTNILPLDWAAFRKECFSILSSFGDTYSHIEFAGHCSRILVETEGKQWIAGGRVLQEEFTSTYYEVYDFGWQHEYGGLSSYSDTPTDDFLVFVQAFSETKTVETLK